MKKKSASKKRTVGKRGKHPATLKSTIRHAKVSALKKAKEAHKVTKAALKALKAEVKAKIHEALAHAHHKASVELARMHAKKEAAKKRALAAAEAKFEKKHAKKVAKKLAKKTKGNRGKRKAVVAVNHAHYAAPKKTRGRKKR
jgi:tetrahydromethanopterin S-methyltransferase subunit H